MKQHEESAVFCATSAVSPREGVRLTVPCRSGPQTRRSILVSAILCVLCSPRWAGIVIFSSIFSWFNSVSPTAFALTVDNPYLSITNRNVFALKEPPPPPSPESLKPPPPNILLQGITTIFGNKRALMKTPPIPGKPGEQPKEQSYILAQGQRDGDLEVLEIDEKGGAVKVNYAGTPITLTFEKNGAKPTPGAAPGPVPPPPGIPSGGIPAPVTPAALTSSGGVVNTGMGSLPTRPLRSSTDATSSASGGAIPALGVGGVAVSTTTPQPAAVQRSAEENVLLYEAARLKREELNKSNPKFKLPRLPSHPLLKGMDAAPAEPVATQ